MLTDAECDAIYTALDDWAREIDAHDFGLPMYSGGGMAGGRDIIRTAVALTSPGYVLVPKEPTEAMLAAAENRVTYYPEFDPGSPKEIWNAMLGAAPKPQGEQP